MNGEADGDGLAMDWTGRVWLNPPYSSSVIGRWLERLADHGRGTALVFARTETEAFKRHIWERATGLLFIYGRLHFHRPTGERAPANSGAPSVLASYGRDDFDRLAASGLRGALVPLRLARSIVVGGLTGSWSDEVAAWLADQRGPVSLSDAYRHFACHPKAQGRKHWQAKIRQTLQRKGRRVGPATWEASACQPNLPGL